jgi:hypothetical protein
VLEHAVFLSCGIVITAQLVATWLQGRVVLTQWLGAFSIYQHRAFVPVILACAVLAAAPVLRKDRIYGPLVPPLLALSFIYALSSNSMLAIFASGVGLLVFGARALPSVGSRKAIAFVLVAVAAIGAQILLLRATPEDQTGQKLIPYAALKSRHALPCTTGCRTQPRRRDGGPELYGAR